MVCIDPVRLNPSTGKGSSRSAHLAHLFLWIQSKEMDHKEIGRSGPVRAPVAISSKVLCIVCNSPHPQYWRAFQTHRFTPGARVHRVQLKAASSSGHVKD